MFEAFIRSRIRRTLLAHLMAQPPRRCYLRGLAKELRVSVGPLHKELHHLERVGLLTSSLEANIRYYTVNQHSALFNELRSLSPHGQAPLSSPASPITSPPPQGWPSVSPAVAPPAMDPDVQRRNRVVRWGMRIGVVSALLVLVSSLVWWVSYLRRMERVLQTFEGVLAEALLQTHEAEEGTGSRALAQ